MNDYLPVVSIGMPVYNGADRMRRALDSILAQDFNEFELFISDNGSTDGTLGICEEYAARDSRITYYQRDRNYGISDNFDFSASRATGKYFMWSNVVFCDDLRYLVRLSDIVENKPFENSLTSSKFSTHIIL